MCRIEDALPQAQKAKLSNMPVWTDIDLARGHEAGDVVDEIRALRWALWRGRLGHPGITDERREKFTTDLNEKVQAAITAGSNVQTLGDWLQLAHGNEPWYYECRIAWIKAFRNENNNLDPEARALKLADFINQEVARRHLTPQQRRQFQEQIKYYLPKINALHAAELAEQKAGLREKLVAQALVHYQRLLPNEFDAANAGPIDTRIIAGIDRCKSVNEK